MGRPGAPAGELDRPRPAERCAGERTLPRRAEVEESERTDVADWDRYRFAAAQVRGLRVLDCACGAGYGSWLMAGSGAKSVVGVDIDPVAVEWARREFAGPACEFRQVQAGGPLPLEPGSVDLVVSFETIEHMDEAAGRRFVAELARVLVPGGRLLLSSPLVRGPERLKPSNPFHVREYDEVELAELVGAEFEVLERLGQHSPASRAFAQAQRAPGGLGAAVRLGLHRLIPSPLRAALRRRFFPAQPGARTTISADDWTSAPVQVLIGRRRAGSR